MKTMKYAKLIFRLLLGLFMTYAGFSHLTFNRQEFVAQVPTWLQFSPAFTDFVVLASGVLEIAFGLGIIFQPVLIFLALWTTGGWKYWKLWIKGKLKE